MQGSVRVKQIDFMHMTGDFPVHVLSMHRSLSMPMQGTKLKAFPAGWQ
jgi:hypothetical protein